MHFCDQPLANWEWVLAEFLCMNWGLTKKKKCKVHIFLLGQKWHARHSDNLRNWSIVECKSGV